MMNASHPPTAVASAKPGPDHDVLAHPLPMRVLLTTLLALLLLTFVTVAVTWIDLGALNVWVALLIAAVKATVVGLYFMHLRYDSPFYSIILAVSLLFVVILIASTVQDSGEYRHKLQSATPASPE